MFEQSALLSIYTSTYLLGTYTTTYLLQFSQYMKQLADRLSLYPLFLLMHAINQPIFYIYLSLMLIHRLDLTIAITGFRMFALLVSTRQPLMTISSIMKCAFSMLNIIYSHKLGQNLLFNCMLGIERRTIVSYIKFTLYQS